MTERHSIEIDDSIADLLSEIANADSVKLVTQAREFIRRAGGDFDSFVNFVFETGSNTDDDVTEFISQVARGNDGGDPTVSSDPGLAEPSDLETIILSYNESRPPALRRLVRFCGPRLYRAVAGGEESNFIPATVVGTGSAIRLPSERFATAADAFLSGFGPGATSVKQSLVRFLNGVLTVDVSSFPTDPHWGLYCLSSEEDPAEAEHLEVFALRWGEPPDAGAEPYDFVEAGHIATARQIAKEQGWDGTRIDALKIMMAVRMELLINEAIADIGAQGWVASGEEYLVDKFESAGKRIVTGTVQATGSRLRKREDT